MGLRFSKMHGAGNDFVLLDRRAAREPLAADLIARLCDRRCGVGCDQLLTIEPPRSPGASFAYGIWNQDGSPAGQCGNGARCVVAWAQRAGLFSGSTVRADSPSGTIEAWLDEDGIEIDMGRPDFAAAAVGFVDTARPRSVHAAGVEWPFALVSMGNPHALIEVTSVAQARVAELGPLLQGDARFSAGCNVGFAEVIDRGHIALRVFERGVGETLACGSGACAAVALLHRAGRVDTRVRVSLPGGVLQIHWPQPNASIRMRGPAAFVFEGEFHA